jgi:hypothetical protein
VQCPSDVPFFALLQYSTKPQTPTTTFFRRCAIAVKGMHSIKGVPAVPQAVKRLQTQIASGNKAMCECFTPGCVVVPIPSSTILTDKQVTAPMLLCKEMVKQGVAAEVAPLLRRTKTIPKAHLSKSGDRTTFDTKVDSLAVDHQPVLSGKGDTFVLVDDVITTGCTMLAALAVLQNTYPQAQIRCFAMLRAVSYQEQVTTMIFPVKGLLTYPPHWREP